MSWNDPQVVFRHEGAASKVMLVLKKFLEMAEAGGKGS